MKWMFFEARTNSYKSIFIVYLCITLFSLMALSFFISNNIKNSSKATSKQRCEKINRYLVTYLDTRVVTAKEAALRLSTNYSNQQEVLYLLENGYANYNKYKLEAYLKAPTVKESFESYVKARILKDKDIKGIILQPIDGDDCYIYSGRSKIIFPVNTGIPEIKEFNLTEPLILPCRNIKYGLNEDEMTQVYSYACKITEPYSLEVKGFLIVDFVVDGIKNALNEVNKDFSGDIMVFTQKGELIFNRTSKKEISEEMIFNKYKNFEGIDESQEGLVSVLRLRNSEMFVVSIVPHSVLFNEYSGKLIILMIWTSIIVLFVIAITYITTRHFSRRVEHVMQGIGEIRNGNLKYRIPDMNGRDEISDIGIGFNELCDYLDTYMKRVYVLELEQKDAELKALQARINPHFLFNTLESIRMSTLISGADEAAEMIYLLSSIFRISIREKTVVSIRDELETSRMYLDLFQIRYKGSMNVKINADAKTKGLGIFKYTIQPVIENYVLYGFDVERNDNLCSVDVYVEEGKVIIKVSDNGKGMDEEKLLYVRGNLENTKASESGGFGLSSVNERIRLVFGKDYGIKIDSKKEVGTVVSIELPPISKKEMESYVQVIHS